MFLISTLFHSIQHAQRLKNSQKVSGYVSTQEGLKPNSKTDGATEKKRKSSALVDSNLSGMTKALNEKAQASMKRVKKSQNDALRDAEARLDKITQDLIGTLKDFRKKVLFYFFF